MAKRNYNITMVLKKENRIHIIYTDNEGVKVDLSVLEKYPVCDGNIYHLTPIRNIENILKNGLELHSRDNEYGITYPPRVYFFPFKQFAYEYHQVMLDEHNTEKLALFAIPIKKLKDITFYFDPLTAQYQGLYTKTKIDCSNDLTYEII